MDITPNIIKFQVTFKKASQDYTKPKGYIYTASVTTGRREKWRENWTPEKRENWTREKSDTGRREKWREKDKTTVGCRAFEVLKPRSWEWNPVPVSRGPETQVLRVKPSVRLSRSFNPGPQSQIPRSWNPMSWKPNAATRACRHGRIVSDRHGYPLVDINSLETHCIRNFQLDIIINKTPRFLSRGLVWSPLLICHLNAFVTYISNMLGMNNTL
jgi:hypothetical protein